MVITELPDALLEGEGVTFQYLLMSVECDGQSRQVVRGLCYTPYAEGAEDRILDRLRRELSESGGKYSVEGGGSLTLNPYNETIILYGKNPAHGAEPDREISVRALQQSFPDHKVSWFPPEVKAPEKAAKAKKKAAEPEPSE